MNLKHRLRIAELERKNLELSAQLAHVYHFAKAGIATANRDRLHGSGVLVQLHFLGGKEVCKPFVLKDGLSDTTIAGLTHDLQHSYAQVTSWKV
jgi:hypothetical protein